MEEIVQVVWEQPISEKLQSNGIRVIKNKTLLAAGEWNGKNYSKEEISKSFYNTNWSDPDVISLIADHRDDDKKGRPLTIRDWLGFVSNQYLSEDGESIIGDLNLCDSDLATKLIDGKANFGISPYIKGMYDELSNQQRDFAYQNFAIVVEPACKRSFINSYLADDELGEKLSEISAKDRIRKRLGLSEEEYSKLSETTPGDMKGKETDSHGLQKVKTKKKVDSISLKGGKTNMENKNKLEEEIEEVVEEVKVEEPVEEVKEESEVESMEEESDDKLVEQIAKLTEKLMSKRKLTPEQAKLNALESKVDALIQSIAKLSEAKVEKVSSDKLSASPKTRAITAPKEASFKVFGKQASQGSQELAAMLGY